MAIENIFDGSWIPKVGGSLSAAGTAIFFFAPVPGIVMIGIGAALGFFTRQDNKSSEAVGIKSPEVVVVVEPPKVKVLQQPLMPPPK